jgi:hypothetical protein
MLENMFLCQKSYLCKILSKLYDPNGFKPYMCFVFQNLSMCHYVKIHRISIFWAVFEVFGTAEAVFTGHVRPMDQRYPVSRTCLAHGPDMFGSRVSAYIYKGAGYPFEP